ncbi:MULTISPECIES: sugar ABC transporter permease [Ruminococcus]|jgi:ABC-type sugar transport system permease subunit|uniref:ABC transporter, permease protein n=1 Tax=Ruminococcus albus 8 TaxID=246199 RepID=E9SA14_RUMAL|nr:MULTISPECIES: sugar ABC transporter permease [Ruminococcus]EGC03928.1 ABC transporter, permease protein [Ruminococcus albus 8]MBO5558970.1 sugar ABC transporter permease [Ruminococcus sp.]MBR0529284.1 sugar ABC transporter permease [Ruminococcus sp.]MCC3350507.1 sugar ABC transporter permease [Ruminococcus albus 8]
MSDTEKTTTAAAPAKAEKKHRLSYEKRKGLYGYGFIALWALGTIYFFIYPLIVSIIYSFNETHVQPGGMEMKYIGWKNYVNAFRKDQDYSLALVDMLKNTALRTPLIIIFSIFIALVLNQKFKGRTFARAVFFLPVIIATGPVMDIINGNMSTGGYSGGSEQFSTMFEANLVDQLLNFLGIYNISDKLSSIINSLTTDIFNLVWNSGIQILLILAALQGISPASKEAAQMEGATSWEFFWKITLPTISPMILASVVYTVVDSFVDPGNKVMTIVLNKSTNWDHGYSAAMAWAYFAIIGVCLAIIVAILNKVIYYEVE